MRLVELLDRWGALALALLWCGPATLRAQAQPAWQLSREAKNGLADLWDGSITRRREAVACLGGWLEGDTVHLTTVQPLDLSASDSLTAGAEESLARCGPPEWIGTVHTHIRSTDDDQPSPNFSPGDRNVMSAWSARWGAQGAFCLLHGDGVAKCEVYPPGLPLRPRQP